MHPNGQNRRRLQDFHSPVTSKLRQVAVTPMACARFPPVKRTAATLVSILAALLVSAPAAMAENGVGLAGPTDDRMITFFGFGVIAFFALLPIVLSLIQGRLEKRKEQRRSDLQRYS
jgi:hypothetical protein